MVELPSRQELDRRKAEKPLTEQWVNEGETLRWIELPVQAHAASVIGQKATVPHEPLSAEQKSLVEKPNWPLPSKQIEEGAFRDDEWADELSVHWWAFADQAERDAVRCADHIANVPGEALLAITDQRAAVVVRSNQVTDVDEAGSSLFSRARSVAQKAVESLPSPSRPLSYFEVPADRIAAIQGIVLGRSLPRDNWIRIDFTDRSTFYARSTNIDQDPAEVFPAR
ncbi:hypothetical protein QFW96_03100 [Saccharopolyspora sp. TS4A08]|uniref:Uncharacterized protein n=1 Tax=Saccharopolyspora ipomoeae TaxID=3042027 RepID=A0ABT6PI01_9PSEU|nr:hypothetical protein [Saccharopolyspora sp. TS4A08]MDI2027579.1 hypothetical protein [Saccharopolyspora sp. TS4A08]